MGVIRFPAVEALLDAALDKLTPQDIQLACSKGQSSEPIREDTQLDFKSQLYGLGEPDKASLATDVAALANAAGGLLLLGVDDQQTGAAQAVTEVLLSDSEERRMRQIVAQRTAPLVAIEIRPIPGSAPDLGFYLVTVARSSLAPHAVIAPGNQRLEYPRRDGNRNRYMSEQEVATTYRDRFRMAGDQTSRASELYDEGVAKLRNVDADRVWLCASAVPTYSVPFRIDQTRRDEILRWASKRSASRLLPPNGPTTGWKAVSVAFRRIVLHDDYSRRLYAAAAELHTDGSSFVAFGVGLRPNVGAYPEVDPRSLIEGLRDAMDLVVQFGAEQALASGDALLIVGLENDGRQPIAIRRFGGFPAPNPKPAAPFHPVSLTIDLAGAAASESSLLQAVRLASEDLLQQADIVDVAIVDAQGRIRPTEWDHRDQLRVGAWAMARGVGTF